MSVNLPAITIWREARGEGQLGMLAVAFVIHNRADHGGLWPMDPDRVCLQRKQFSCWNDNDHQRDLYPDSTPDAPVYEIAVAQWSLVWDGAAVIDPTGGATYYVNAAAVTKNPFANPVFMQTAVIKNHTFYKDAPRI